MSKYFWKYHSQKISSKTEWDKNLWDKHHSLTNWYNATKNTLTSSTLYSIKNKTLHGKGILFGQPMTCSWPRNTKLDQNPKCIFYSMGCPHNLVNGRGLKVNTAAHAKRQQPRFGRAAEVGSALAAVLTFCPRPYNRFCGQPIRKRFFFAKFVAFW